MLPAMALTAEQLSFFEREGYLVLRSFLAAEEREAMLQEAMASWTATKGDGPPSADGTWLQASLLPDVHHHSRLVRDYYWRGPLVEIASQLIGPNVKCATAQLTFKLRGNTRPFAWHQDNGYGHLEPANAVSCLTAFDDADEESGCLWVVPQSHRMGQLKSLTLEQKAAQAELALEVDEATAAPVPMSAGDVLLMHCHMLHRSGGNHAPRDRRILFLRYADADAVEVYNDGKPRLGKLVKGTSAFEEVTKFERHLEE